MSDTSLELERRIRTLFLWCCWEDARTGGRYRNQIAALRKRWPVRDLTDDMIAVGRYLAAGSWHDIADHVDERLKRRYGDLPLGSALAELERCLRTRQCVESIVSLRNTLIDFDVRQGVHDIGKVKDVAGRIVAHTDRIKELSVDYGDADLGSEVGADGVEELERSIEGDADWFRTGVSCLDERNVKPRRGALFMVMGPSNAGKSWFLVNIGSQALRDGKRVLHVTLEMSSSEVRMRYLCNLGGFYMGRGEGRAVGKLPVVVEQNRMFGALDIGRIEAPPFYTQEAVRSLRELFDGTSGSVLVKEFPTRQMDHGMLVAYLEKYARSKGGYPDMLIIDYFDLMKMDLSNFRLSLDNALKELRGLAVDHGMALVTATQSNRAGVMSESVEGFHVAENWGKHADSDVFVTMTKNSSEKAVGLCRLYVDKSRYSRAGFTVVVAQKFEFGIFCGSCAVLPDRLPAQYKVAVESFASEYAADMDAIVFTSHRGDGRS